MVSNAVDFKAYNSNKKSQLPNDIAIISSPIIGYSGLIAKRLDLNLIKYLAENNPKWSMIFVGKIDMKNCEKQLEMLKKYFS